MRTIGIDIGTTSLSSVVQEDGEVLAAACGDHGGSLPTPHGFEDIQDADLIVGQALAETDRLAAEYAPVDAVGVTGQMHGIVYVDRRGRAVSPLFTWLDLRGDEPAPSGTTFRGEFSGLTGTDVPAGYGLLTHYYNKVRRNVPDSAATFCGITDYAVMRLCGLDRPAMNPSNAFGFGCFDLETLSFDANALTQAGIDLSILPEVDPGYRVLGERNGVPVYTAVGDNQASFAGAVVRPDSGLFVNVGTGSQISRFSRNLVRVEGLETRPYPTGGWLLCGAALAGGKSYALLKSFFSDVLSFFGAPAPDEDLYELMNRAAVYDDGAGITVFPGFYGTRSDPSVRGAITRIDGGNLTAAGMINGFVEGMVDELFGFYRLLPDECRNGVRTLYGAGNGIRRNPLLRAAFERRFAMDLVTAPYPEEAAYGAAVLLR